MSVSACWNVSTDRPAESADVGWNEVGQGLKLVGAGYVLMIAGTCLGLFLAWPAISGKELSGARALSPSEEQASLVAGLVAVGVATLCSFLLIVAGQWRCLMQAPGNESAKELMYASIICIFSALIMHGFGTYAGGAKNYIALGQGMEGLDKLDFRHGGGALQLLSAALGLLNVLIFSHFLRRIAIHFADRSRVRAVEMLLLFTCLLVGASAGAYLWRHRLPYMSELALGLAVGWLVCLVWHPFLIASIRACIQRGVQRAQPKENPVASWLAGRIGRPTSPA